MMTKDNIISEDSLNNIENVINAGSERYAADEMLGGGFFSQAFLNYPKNDRADLIAMKMSLVDTTNSTNLGRLLGNKDYYSHGKHIQRKVFTFSDLINKILSMPDFDKRIENGDRSLVSELTSWGKEHGANMMSFFSKYCLYHNYFVYKKDDYSIFDSVVRDNLGKYVTLNEIKELLPDLKIRKNYTDEDTANLLKNQIENMRLRCDYEAYCELIDGILRLRGINEKNVPKCRRKLDYLVWYSNR